MAKLVTYRGSQQVQQLNLNTFQVHLPVWLCRTSPAPTDYPIKKTSSRDQRFVERLVS